MTKRGIVDEHLEALCSAVESYTKQAEQASASQAAADAEEAAAVAVVAS